MFFQLDRPLLTFYEFFKIYSIQKGGNAFINFWYDRHFYKDSKTYIAGYSDNGNPYYKTHYYSKQWYTGYATAVYVKQFSKRRNNTFVTRNNHRKNFSSSPKLLSSNTSLIIDGLNVCRWNKRDNGKPDLVILMTLLVKVAKKGYDFFCFFDANTPHVLNGNRSEVNYGVYKELIENHQKKFGEVPGRIRADDFILKAADTKKASIVSNDQFRDYITQYLWLRDDNRLLKGMVANEKLLIPSLGLEVPMRKDLKKIITHISKIFECLNGIQRRDNIQISCIQSYFSKTCLINYEPYLTTPAWRCNHHHYNQEYVAGWPNHQFPPTFDTTLLMPHRKIPELHLIPR